MNIPSKSKNIIIHGNIGSGKSTLISILSSTFPEINLIPEPVDIWTNLYGNNVLKSFYDNTPKYAFSFQILCIISRINVIKDKYKDNKINVFERNILEDRYIFTDMLADNKIIDSTEKAIYDYIFDTFCDTMKKCTNYNIFLEASISTLMKRIKQRGRKEESGITEAYLNQIDKKYENLKKMVDPSSIYVINTENDFKSDIKEQSQIIEFFRNLIQN